MADDGIDRDAEKRMEFSTSKEVQVAPTFEAMHLKENLLRGYGVAWYLQHTHHIQYD